MLLSCYINLVKNFDSPRFLEWLVIWNGESKFVLVKVCIFVECFSDFGVTVVYPKKECRIDKFFCGWVCGQANHSHRISQSFCICFALHGLRLCACIILLSVPKKKEDTKHLRMRGASIYIQESSWRKKR